MINQILNIGFMSMVATAQGLALDQMLEANNQKTTKYFRVLYWTAMAIFLSMVNVMVDGGNTTVPLQGILTIIFILFPLFLFYRDPMWRRILAIILVYIGVFSADFIALILLNFMNIGVEVLYDKTTSISVFVVGTANSLSIVTIAIIAVAWKKFFHKGSKMTHFGFFALYVFNYLVSLVLMEIELNRLEVGMSELLPVLTSTICEIALLAIVFSQAEKEALETKLTEQRKKTELEQIYYSEVKRRREEILKISDDNRQEILKIQQLLKDESSEMAETELKNLLRRIENTKENQYCSIPIVNAILTEKQRECEQYQKIALETNIRIPEEIAIKQMDLCSIFSNLLDNAIRASKKVASELQHESDMDESAKIHLTVAVKGNYLIVKCDNSTVEEPAKTPEGSGYGQKILRDIAKRYQGDFRTNYENKRYYAQLTIKWNS